MSFQRVDSCKKVWSVVVFIHAIFINCVASTNDDSREDPQNRDLLFNYNGTIDSAIPFAYPKTTNNETKILGQLDLELSKCNGIDIREITIVEIQGLYATNQLTSRQLTECYLKRIQAMNPYLNSVIQTNPDALWIAKKLDLERTLWKVRGPLHGIPILVKDNYATADKMETTAGSWALVGVLPVMDSEVVSKLRFAGAIILGKANLAEFSFWRGSNVPNGWSGRGGQTKNAYNLNVNPEGSSSGSAVSTSANMVAVSIGTETDGSLISPAGIASCVAIKPTFGIVSTSGIIPVSSNQDTAGPITRNVMDAAFVLDGMVSQHRQDLTECGGTYAACLMKENLQPMRIGVPRLPFWSQTITNSTFLEYEVPILEQVLNAIKANHLISVTDPVAAPWESLRNMSHTETIMVSHDFKQNLNKYLNDYTVQYSLIGKPRIRNLEDVINFNKLHPTPEGYNQDLLEMSQATNGFDNATYTQARQTNRFVTTNYLRTLLYDQGFDAIAVPSEPRYIKSNNNPTLRHNPFQGWSVAAISGFPSITVPAGYDQLNIPFGICFIGKPYTEAILLRIAKTVEDTCHARKPPQFSVN